MFSQELVEGNNANHLELAKATWADRFDSLMLIIRRVNRYFIP